jgi:hypothetical protein
MSNLRSVSVDVHPYDLDGSAERARLRRLASLFDEVTLRVASLRMRADVAPPDEAAVLRAELALLEDDWRCLASAQTYAVGFARVG